ncbi:hypothetical protein U1Q18_041491 [Sarracenia purpurea var. burkii]
MTQDRQTQVRLTQDSLVLGARRLPRMSSSSLSPFRFLRLLNVPSLPGYDLVPRRYKTGWGPQWCIGGGATRA